MSLSYREATLAVFGVSHTTGAGSYDVTAYPVGAIASAGSSGTTITVDAGHSFRAGDKYLLGPGGANTFSGTDTVQSVTATTVVMGQSVTVSSGDVLVNLGPDTGTSAPNYDASPVAIYSDADGSTAVSNSRVTCDGTTGEFSYYHKGDGRFWELVRNSAAAVVDVVKGIGGVAGRYNVCDYGAKGDGSTDDMLRIQSAVDACNGAGGGVVWFPQSTYVCDNDITIGNSYANVTIDLGGSIIKSASANNARFAFDGDNSVDGDFSVAPTNCWLINGTFGDANDSNNTFLGPDFHFCVDSGARNLIKKGKGGTGYNVRKCRRVLLENCWNYGSDVDDNKIGFLCHVSDYCTFRNCHVVDSSNIYAFQNKGGESNRYEGCTVSSQDEAVDGFAVPAIAFRDRGDKPWGTSTSSGTYPYSTGAWASADDQRASKNCVFSNCTVDNSSKVNAYLTQESFGTQFVNCTADDVETLCVATKLSGGSERDYLFSGVRGSNVGTTENTTAGAITIQNNDTAGIEGVRIDNCSIDTCEGQGIKVGDADQCRITNCNVRNPGQGGDGGVTQAGIYLADSNRPFVSGCECIDDQGSPTMMYGILTDDDTVTWPTIIGCYSSGATTNEIQAWLPGHYAGNNPAEGSLTTTDATVTTTAWRCHMKDATAVWIELTAMAMETDGSNRAVYKLGGLFYRDGASAAQQGSDMAFMHGNTAATLTDSSGGTPDQTISAVTDQTETTDISVVNDNFAEVADEINALVADATPDIESEDWGGLGFAVSGEYVRSQVTGKAATNINWRVYARCTEIV